MLKYHSVFKLFQKILIIINLITILLSLEILLDLIKLSFIFGQFLNFLY